MGIRSFLHLRITSARTREFIRRVLVAFLVATIFLAGIQLRHWIGENTRHVRYQHDIVNGFYWGNEVLAEARSLSPDEASANSWAGFWRGYVGLYDRVKDDAYKMITASIIHRFAYSSWASGQNMCEANSPRSMMDIQSSSILC